MPLPDPVEVTVPSAADGSTRLESRIYLPPASPSSRNTHASLWRKAAIVAHPYAPLGGSFDDPTVLLVAQELFDAGFTVVTFNFRRRTSWTSKPELRDYISVARFLLYFMLHSNASPSLAFDVVFAGYSYGAMIASQVPPVQDLLGEQLNDEPEKLSLLAKDVAVTTVVGGSQLNGHDINIVAASSVTRYLLISPVLPPVTTLLTFSLKSLDYKHLKANSTLAVYGTRDNFTSGKKLRQWAESLGIQFNEVDGAGHFWFEQPSAQRLRQAVGAWVRTSTPAE